MHARGFLIGLLALAGCGDDGATGPPDAPRPADAAALDAGPDCPSPPDAGPDDGAADDAGSSAGIHIPPTDGELAQPVAVDIHATGGMRDYVQAVDLNGNVGTVRLAVRGSVPAVVFGRSAFPGYAIYLVLAVAPDRFTIVFVYCNGGEATNIYYEDTGGRPVTLQSAAGSCVERAQPTRAHVQFPAVDLALSNLTTGFRIDGSDIHLESGLPGSLQVGCQRFALYPFNTVDCRSGCASPGWWELHSILWDPTTHRACFSIVYLFLRPPPGHTQVWIAYTLTLPDLSDPAGLQTEFDATWSGP